MTVTASPLTAPRRHRSALTVGIAVVAFAGVPAIWLPFGSDVTPASALFEGGFLLRLWPLAWPYLLAIPIAAALAMLAGGAALGLWALRSGRAPGGLDAIVMMELAYLPNVVLCVLIATSGGALQIGAYAVLLTATAYVAHALAVVSGRVAPRSL